MSVNYRLTFINNSNKIGSVCLLPSNEHGALPNSLIWLAQPVNPGTQATFIWNTQYCFLWNRPGSGPGFASFSQQILPVDPPNNMITLSKSNGNYVFGEAQQGQRPEAIYILCDQSVVPHEVEVGFGMSDSGMFTASALPNTMVSFTPTPTDRYLLAFGEFEPGKPVSGADLSLSTPIQFPVNAFGLAAALNLDLTWSKVFSQ